MMNTITQKWNRTGPDQNFYTWIQWRVVFAFFFFWESSFLLMLPHLRWKCTSLSFGQAIFWNLLRVWKGKLVSKSRTCKIWGWVIAIPVQKIKFIPLTAEFTSKILVALTITLTIIWHVTVVMCDKHQLNVVCLYMLWSTLTLKDLNILNLPLQWQILEFILFFQLTRGLISVVFTRWNALLVRLSRCYWLPSQ